MKDARYLIEFPEHFPASRSKKQRGIERSDHSRKNRRKNKESKSSIASRQRETADDVRENEIRGKRGGPAKKSKDSPARRYRAERRRRRKNRERKRGRKRPRTNGDRDGRRNSKFKRRMNDAPVALLLGKIEDNVSGYNDTSDVIWRDNQQSPSNGSSLDLAGVTSSNLQDQLTTESSKRSTQTTSRYRGHEDTVEREFSKQLEKEISRAQMEDPASLENRILGSSVSHGYKDDRKQAIYNNEVNFASTRYDADKMLGYSRTEEDLPILDLENEVLARTLKDYNAYMTSSLKLSMLPRRDQDEPRKIGGSRFHGKPIIEETEAERYGKKSAETASTTEAYDDDDTKGDLSCINGTFVPAPLTRHALIKYVK